MRLPRDWGPVVLGLAVVVYTCLIIWYAVEGDVLLFVLAMAGILLTSAMANARLNALPDS